MNSVLFYRKRCDTPCSDGSLLADVNIMGFQEDVDSGELKIGPVYPPHSKAWFFLMTVPEKCMDAFIERWNSVEVEFPALVHNMGPRVVDPRWGQVYLVAGWMPYVEYSVPSSNWFFELLKDEVLEAEGEDLTDEWGHYLLPLSNREQWNATFTFFFRPTTAKVKDAMARCQEIIDKDGWGVVQAALAAAWDKVFHETYETKLMELRVDRYAYWVETGVELDKLGKPVEEDIEGDEELFWSWSDYVTMMEKVFPLIVKTFGYELAPEGFDSEPDIDQIIDGFTLG